MKIKTLLCTSIMLSGVAFGQPKATNPDGSLPTDTVIGVATTDMSEIQTAILDAYKSKELAEINAQIEALMEKREELMFATATKKHPGIAHKIKNVSDAYKAQKKKNKAGGG